MDGVERAVPAPQIEIIVQARAWRQVFRDRAPLAARAQDVHQTVDNLAHVHRPLIPTALGRRDTGLDQRPFRIGQVARIAKMAAVVAGTVFGRPRRRLPQNQAATLESQTYVPGQTLRPVSMTGAQPGLSISPLDFILPSLHAAYFVWGHTWHGPLGTRVKRRTIALGGQFAISKQGYSGMWSCQAVPLCGSWTREYIRPLSKALTTSSGSFCGDRVRKSLPYD
jgi:diadenosine tetraphosphatase ApaH/serine/threonine PP2A family protein phosphatase